MGGDFHKIMFHCLAERGRGREREKNCVILCFTLERYIDEQHEIGSSFYNNIAHVTIGSDAEFLFFSFFRVHVEPLGQFVKSESCAATLFFYFVFVEAKKEGQLRASTGRSQ